MSSYPTRYTIIPDVHGRPTCELHKKALEMAGGAHILISITHEAGMAAATAILEA